MKIKKINLEIVKAQNWKPEPHTVSLKDDGEWWGLFDGENLVSVLCVSDKHGGKYFSENYTAPQYRGKGYFSLLLDYVANCIYQNELCIAHCLRASVNCYLITGFKHNNTRFFKYGIQYFMRREAGNGTT